LPLEKQHPIKFVVNLTHTKNGKETQKGQVEVRGQLTPIPSTSDFAAQKKGNQVNIRVAKVECKDFFSGKSTEFDVAALEVNLSCGMWKGNIDNMQKVSNVLSWTENESKKVTFSLDSEEVTKSQFNVIVATKAKQSVDLGSGSTSFIESKIPSTGFSKDAYVLEIKLFDEKKKPCGIMDVHLFLELEDSFNKFKAGKLLIKRIVCQDLSNVESFGGKNDPYILLKLGPEKRQTAPIQEGGSSVTFDLLDMSLDVGRDTIEFDQMNVKVMDKNDFNDDVLIGECDMPVMPLLHRVNEVVEFRFQLVNAKKKSSGVAILFLQLVDIDDVQSDLEVNLVPIDPNFREGLLQISKVRAFDLKNTKALFNGAVNNPYLKLKFASWNVKTSYVSMAKQKVPIFDHLCLETEVSLDDVMSVPLIVEVLEANTMVDAVIGSGQCFIRPVAAQIGTEVELKVDITNSNVPAGRLVIYARIVEKPVEIPEPDFKIPGDFEEGAFHIKSITANNLKNTELLGQQVQSLYILVFVVKLPYRIHT